MRQRLAGVALAIAVAAFGVAPSAVTAADGAATDLAARLNHLEADVIAAEDLSALKRLQRAYGYYLDKGMWEDLQAGRATEIDWLNGEVVRLAASLGRTAPVNGRLVALVREAEKGGRRDWKGEELLRELQTAR